MKRAAMYLAFLLISGLWGSAWAQAGVKSGVAENLWREGIRLSEQAGADQALLQRALVKMRESRRLDPRPVKSFGIAQVLERLGRLGSAYQGYDQAFHEAYQVVPEQRRLGDGAQRARDALEARVPRLRLALPRDLPEGCVLRLDSEVLDPDLWRRDLPLDPGEHRLVLSGPRIRTLAQVVFAEERRSQTVPLQPQRLPLSWLRLQLEARPAGLVAYVDGRQVSDARLDRDLEVAPGRHRVRVVAPGYAVFQTTTAPLADGDRATVPVRLSWRTGAPRWVFFAVATTALAGLGLGTGMLVKAKLADGAQRDLAPQLRDPSVKDEIRRDLTVSWVSFAFGGLAGVGAVVLGATTRWRDDEGRRGVTGVWGGPTDTGVALGLTGRF